MGDVGGGIGRLVGGEFLPGAFQLPDGKRRSRPGDRIMPAQPSAAPTAPPGLTRNG
jgi:hypothetical protein